MKRIAQLGLLLAALAWCVPAWSVACPSGNTHCIQETITQVGNTGAAVSVAMGSNVTSGHILVWFLSSFNNSTITSVAKSAGTATVGANSTDVNTLGSNTAVRLAGGHIAITGSGSVTIDATMSVQTQLRDFAVYEISAAAFDCGTGQEQAAPGTGTNGVTSTGCTATGTGDYVMGAAMDEGGFGITFTAGTSPIAFAANGSGSSAGNLTTEDATNAGTGATAATMTASSSHPTNAAVLTFTVSGAAAATGFDKRRRYEVLEGE